MSTIIGRSDLGETIDGSEIEGISITGSDISPDTDDGKALGTTSEGWSDLHLASGGTVNWKNGDTTLTHTDGVGLSLGASTITSSGTDDYGLEITQTLNDPSAAGGSDTYRALKVDITSTDVTGWDSLMLFDWMVDGAARFRLSGGASPILTMGSPGTSPITIQALDQSGGNSAGRSLSIASGDAFGATTGAAGGSVNLSAGDAAGSGNNNGGDITLTPGSSTGSGLTGGVLINQAGGTPGTDTLAIQHNGTDGLFANLDSSGGFRFADNTFTTLFSVNGTTANFSNGVVYNTTTSAAGNYTVLATDYIVLKTGITGGGDTVTLPAVASVATGQVFIIKDSGGGAATDNITIDGNGAETIDGAATLVLNTDYGSATLVSNGTEWNVL